jgi:glycerol-3-phosphate acyltransferase PlsX
LNIALDAMGGDHAPKAIVEGALEALPLLNRKLFLVGVIDQIQPFLPSVIPDNLEIVPAKQSVGMDEKPIDAYRTKKESSLLLAALLVKEGKAEVMVSAGNTGAAASFSQLSWRQIEGIHRPAIAARIPNRHNGFLLLDSGASPDIDPEHLVEFAIMGRSYCRTVMGRQNPRVHLLNIGEEPGKGNAFAKEAFALLSKFDWFAGNIEGKDAYRDPCDVIVCDAFVGNVFLKASEGVAEMITAMIRELVPTHPVLKLAYWPLKSVGKSLRKKLDYDESGGAPLLGLNGLCIISHGRSNSKAIKNALLLAQTAIENKLVASIKETIQLHERKE